MNDSLWMELDILRWQVTNIKTELASPIGEQLTHAGMSGQRQADNLISVIDFIIEQE